jgi:hypothetical protein
MVRRSKRLSSLNQSGEEPQPVRTEQTRTDEEVENWVMKELEKRKNQQREEGMNLDETEGPSDWSVQNTPKLGTEKEPKNRGEAIDDYLAKKEKRKQFLLTPSAKIPRVGQNNSGSIKKSGSKRAATPRKNATNQKRQLAFEAIKVDESEKALDDVMEEDETENPSLMELPKTPAKTPAKSSAKTPVKSKTPVKTPAKTPIKSKTPARSKTPRSKTPLRSQDDVTMTSESQKSETVQSKTPAKSKTPARSKTPSRRKNDVTMTLEPEKHALPDSDQIEPEKKSTKTPVKTRSKTPAKTPSMTPAKTPAKTPVASGTATKTPSQNTRKSINPKKDLKLDQSKTSTSDVIKPGVSLRKRNLATQNEDAEIKFKVKNNVVPQTPLPHKFPDPKAASTPRFQFGKKANFSKNSKNEKTFAFGGNSTGNRSKLGEKSIQSKSPSIALGEKTQFKNSRERALAYAKKVATRNNRRMGVKGMTKAKQRAKIANKENN